MPSPSPTPPPSPTPESLVAPHLGPVVEEGKPADRDRFAAAELAIVISHYDLGVIRGIRDFPRGSRRSPKVRIATQRGPFLLKRRAPGRDDPKRVAFAHDLQERLAVLGYPVAGLVPPRRGRRSMLRIRKRVYEMFQFVEGEREDRSADAAREAGRTLGRLHHLLRDYPLERNAEAQGSYHAVPGVGTALQRIPGVVRGVETAGSDDDELGERCRFLRAAYRDAARRAAEAGLEDWPRSVVHGDWHPGNLVYREGVIVAVLDFDSARVAPRVIDVANAALQFSMNIADPNAPETWPDELDLTRMRALLAGYDESSGTPVSSAERRAVPWLVLEALILESVIPIAATGRFGPIGGRTFLEFVERKVRWLRPRGPEIAAFLGA